jgi:flagellar hook assembly protein FlgD
VTIRFVLPDAGPATLRVVDASGRVVATLVDRQLGAGSHLENSDGRGADGRRMPPGFYFFDLRAGGLSSTRRSVLVR